MANQNANGSSSPNARNTELPRGSPTNCGNHAWIGCCSKFASLASIHITILPSTLQNRVSDNCASSTFVRLVGMYILMPPLKNKLRASHVDCRIALVTLARDYRRICRRKKTKTRCWVVVLKKIGIRGVIQLRSFIKHGIESLIFDLCIIA